MYHAPATMNRIPARVRRAMAPGSSYLGEDDTYYYWMEPGATDQLGGFFDNIGGMFKRMVKFTPKSFTPGNIYKGFVNTTLTTITGGAYQLLPKSLKKSVYDIGKIAIPVVAGGVLAVTAGPAVMGILGPKLTMAAGILGKTAKAVGGPLLGLLNKLPQNKQAEVAQQVTPQDIAYMESTQQIPPYLKPYFDAMAQQTFNPPPTPYGSSGAASLYDPSVLQPPTEPTEPVQAGMLGGLSPVTLGLLVGVPLLFYVIGGNKR